MTGFVSSIRRLFNKRQPTQKNDSSFGFLSSLALFLKALPLLGLWLIIPLLFFVVSLIVQNESLIKGNIDRSQIKTTLVIISPNDGLLSLFVSYPKKVDINQAGTPDPHMSFWLLYPTPTKGPSPTPTHTPAISPTPSFHPATTPTSSPTSTPYSFALNSRQEGLDFVDAEGHPILPVVVLTPAHYVSTPASLYLHPNGSLPEKNSQVEIDVFSNLLANPAAIPMNVETNAQAARRHFFSLFFSSATWGVLAASLVTFAVQQWNQLNEQANKKQEEERKEQEKVINEINTALNKIKNLQSMLEENPAEAARYYLTLRNELAVVQGLQSIKLTLDQIWSRAPEELRNLVLLWKEKENSDELILKAQSLGIDQVEEALQYGFHRKLDEEWEFNSAIILRLLQNAHFAITGDLIEAADRRSWKALIQQWPQISFWRCNDRPGRDTPIADKLKFYRDFDCPFGGEKAENDIWVFDGRYQDLKDQGIPFEDKSIQDALKQKTTSLILLGEPGTGKTAAALWLLQYAIREKIAFPVYISQQITCDLDTIIESFAITMVHQLAVDPASFLQLGIGGRASIARLLSMYVGTSFDLILYLRQAGLPFSGYGLELEHQMKRLIENVPPHRAIRESEKLALLSECRPADFSATWLILDIDEEERLIPDNDLPQRATIDIVSNFLGLVKKLKEIGLGLKIFMRPPEGVNGFALQNFNLFPIRKIEWSYEDLMKLITRRLEQLGDENFASLCNIDGKMLFPGSDLDSYLISHSDHTPRGVIQKGNTILCLFGNKEENLSAEDLSRILHIPR